MRVLFISSKSPFFEVTKPIIGGAEVSLRSIATQLARLGHETHYITLTRGFPKKRIIDGVTVHFISPPRVLLLGRYFRPIAKINIEFYLRSLRKHIERLIKRSGIDLIHSYASFPDTYAALKSAGEYGPPVVQRIAGLATLSDIDDPNIGKDVLWTLNNSDLLLSISPFLKEKLQMEPRIKNPRIQVLDIGIDRFSEPKRSVGRGITTFVSISSFKTNAKRQDILIKASSLLAKKGLDFRLFLIGSGERLGQMKNLVRDLGLESRVEFLGTLDRESGLDFLGDKDIFVHASEHEGLCKSILEAMAMGKPVIASDVRAINDFLMDGTTGLLVDNDPVAFSEAMELLSKDPEKRFEMGLNAYKYTHENHSSKINIVRYETLFKGLVGQKKGK